MKTDKPTNTTSSIIITIPFCCVPIELPTINSETVETINAVIDIDKLAISVFFRKNLSV